MNWAGYGSCSLMCRLDAELEYRRHGLGMFNGRACLEAGHNMPAEHLLLLHGLIGAAVVQFRRTVCTHKQQRYPALPSLDDGRVPVGGC